MMMSVGTLSVCSRHHVPNSCSVRGAVQKTKKKKAPPTVTGCLVHNPMQPHPKKRWCRCRSALSPIFGIMFNPILLGILWAIGARKFWMNYSKTTYTAEKRALLTALWPALFVANATYRAQFKNAVRRD